MELGILLALIFIMSGVIFGIGVLIDINSVLLEIKDILKDRLK